MKLSKAETEKVRATARVIQKHLKLKEVAMITVDSKGVWWVHLIDTSESANGSIVKRRPHEKL